MSACINYTLTCFNTYAVVLKGMLFCELSHFLVSSCHVVWASDGTWTWHLNTFLATSYRIVKVVVKLALWQVCAHRYMHQFLMGKQTFWTFELLKQDIIIIIMKVMLYLTMTVSGLDDAHGYEQPDQQQRHMAWNILGTCVLSLWQIPAFFFKDRLDWSDSICPTQIWTLLSGWKISINRGWPLVAQGW